MRAQRKSCGVLPDRRKAIGFSSAVLLVLAMVYGATPRFPLLRSSPIDSLPPSELRDVLQELAASGPAVSRPVRPIPASNERDSGNGSDIHAFAAMVRVTCDDVEHQVAAAEFGAWADQMHDSRIQRVRIDDSQTATQDWIEYSRLASWPHLVELDVSRCNKSNMVQSKRGVWTSQGAEREFPTVRRLKLSWGPPSLGTFPAAEEVQLPVWPTSDETRRAIEQTQQDCPQAKIATYDPWKIIAAEQQAVQEQRQNSRHKYCTHDPTIHSLDQSVAPHAISQLVRLELVDCPHLANVSVLQRMSQLRYLKLYDCQTNLTVEWLGSTQLDTLRLGWCRLPADFAELRTLAGLRVLELNACRPIDLPTLARFTQLEELSLAQYDDLSDLSALHNMTQLRKLVIQSCPQVSLAEIRRLQRWLPATAVHFDFRPE